MKIGGKWKGRNLPNATEEHLIIVQIHGRPIRVVIRWEPRFSPYYQIYWVVSDEEDANITEMTKRELSAAIHKAGTQWLIAQDKVYA